jgi:hypothetical protein
MENTENATVDQTEAALEKFISKVDTVKVDSIKKKIDAYVNELKDKEYALSMDSKKLSTFETFMSEQVEWRSKEALGVKEILRRLDEVKKEGIQNGAIYFTNLEVEASHYFLMKWNGKGSKEVDLFISLWKTFEESLILVQQDNAKMEELKKELSAAEQGLELL